MRYSGGMKEPLTGTDADLRDAPRFLPRAERNRRRWGSWDAFTLALRHAFSELARLSEPKNAAARSPVSRPYDPETEANPLISAQIGLNPVTGESVFREFPYPVWAVVLNLIGTGFNRAAVKHAFPELSLDATRAAELFWHLHADEIRPYLN